MKINFGKMDNPMNSIMLTLAQGYRAHGLAAWPSRPYPMTQVAQLAWPLARGACPHRGHRSRGVTVARSSSAPQPAGWGTMMGENTGGKGGTHRAK
jgi:hypothetical protein